MGKNSALRLQKIEINTYTEPIIFMRQDCQVCLSEGFDVHTRVLVSLEDRSIIATVNTVKGDLLASGYAALSDIAWKQLGASEGAEVHVDHAPLVRSLSFVRSKIYGNELGAEELSAIANDIADGRYSNIQISSFLTACAGGNMTQDEITYLTEAMVNVGERLRWESPVVVDKHCVGGLPGNRTTPIVVPIVAAFGLTMPKTSSRAITSPAGTADVMEVLTNVELDLASMRKVVSREKACMAWGGAVALSPVDDTLIGIERTLDLDGEGQLIASVLSKKISAGANHVLIDIPIGVTAKVRSQQMADVLRVNFEAVGRALGIVVKVIYSDGSQPIGCGIGPSLEARDVLRVLKNEENAPQRLRDKALDLAGGILEFSDKVNPGQGREIATSLLESGEAWEKFQSICRAQGAIRTPPIAAYSHPVEATVTGTVTAIDNRRLAQLAKLAGAPYDKTAGLDLHCQVGTLITAGQALFTLNADSTGQLNYALRYLSEEKDIIKVE